MKVELFSTAASIASSQRAPFGISSWSSQTSNPADFKSLARRTTNAECALEYEMNVLIAHFLFYPNLMVIVDLLYHKRCCDTSISRRFRQFSFHRVCSSSQLLQELICDFVIK